MKRLQQIGSLLSVAGLVGVAQAQPALSVPTTSIELGGIIQIEIDPATSVGYEFTDETSVGWLGSYSSMLGTSGNLVVSIPAAQVHLVDDYTLQVVLGTGILGGAVDPAILAPGGTLAGTMFTSTPLVCTADFNADNVVDTLDVVNYITAWNLADPSTDIAAPFGLVNILDVVEFLNLWSLGCVNTGNLTGSSSMALNAGDPMRYGSIDFPPTPTGFGPASIAFVVDAPRVFSPPSQTTTLDEGAIDNTSILYALSVVLPSNSLTDLDTTRMCARLLSFDTNGVQIDTVDGILLTKDEAVTGGVRYSSVDQPFLIFVDHAAGVTAAPGAQQIRVVQTEVGGSIRIEPCN